jgi:Tfp pilus assembly protein PilO
MLAEITITDPTLAAATFALAGYIVAAIGWGFRVELKLAKLDQDAKVQKVVADEMRSDVKSLVNFQQESRLHMGSVDQKLEAILERLNKNA